MYKTLILLNISFFNFFKYKSGESVFHLALKLFFIFYKFFLLLKFVLKVENIKNEFDN